MYPRVFEAHKAIMNGKQLSATSAEEVQQSESRFHAPNHGPIVRLNDPLIEPVIDKLVAEIASSKEKSIAFLHKVVDRDQTRKALAQLQRLDPSGPARWAMQARNACKYDVCFRQGDSRDYE